MSTGKRKPELKNKLPQPKIRKKVDDVKLYNDFLTGNFNEDDEDDEDYVDDDEDDEDDEDYVEEFKEYED
jgi:hypothetical protein